MDWIKYLTEAERETVRRTQETIKNLQAARQTLRRRANKRAERRKAKEQQQ